MSLLMNFLHDVRSYLFPAYDDPRFENTPPWGWPLSIVAAAAFVFAMFAPLMFAHDIIQVLEQWGAYVG